MPAYRNMWCKESPEMSRAQHSVPQAVDGGIRAHRTGRSTLPDAAAAWTASERASERASRRTGSTARISERCEIDSVGNMWCHRGASWRSLPQRSASTRETCGIVRPPRIRGDHARTTANQGVALKAKNVHAATRALEMAQGPAATSRERLQSCAAARCRSTV
eukprot:IDg16384t1